VEHKQTLKTMLTESRKHTLKQIKWNQTNQQRLNETVSQTSRKMPSKTKKNMQVSEQM